MLNKINEVISKLRVYLQNDGGDMEFVSYDTKKATLTIRVKGACVGCAYFDDTFNDGIKSAIKMEIPKIKEIIFI
jgi:Fe-S cluster biogenesis protein NfuA